MHPRFMPGLLESRTRVQAFWVQALCHSPHSFNKLCVLKLLCHDLVNQTRGQEMELQVLRFKTILYCWLLWQLFSNGGTYSQANLPVSRQSVTSEAKKPLPPHPSGPARTELTAHQCTTKTRQSQQKAVLRQNKLPWERGKHQEQTVSYSPLLSLKRNTMCSLLAVHQKGN